MLKYSCYPGYLTVGFAHAKCFLYNDTAQWFGPDVTCKGTQEIRPFKWLFKRVAISGLRLSLIFLVFFFSRSLNLEAHAADCRLRASRRAVILNEVVWRRKEGGNMVCPGISPNINHSTASAVKQKSFRQLDGAASYLSHSGQQLQHCQI